MTEPTPTPAVPNSEATAPASRRPAAGRTPPGRKKRVHPARGARIAVAAFSTSAMLALIAFLGFRASSVQTIAPPVQPAPITIVIHRQPAADNTVVLDANPTEPLATTDTPPTASTPSTPGAVPVPTAAPTAPVAPAPTAAPAAAPTTSRAPVKLDATPSVVTVVEAPPVTQTAGS